MIRETLSGGILRLSGETASFVYQRVSPGVLLTLCRGSDTGEFGAAPLEILDREYRLFQRPVRWFFDATRAENVTRAVSEQWTAWLRTRQEIIERMHILAGTRRTHLIISIARHFSNTSSRLTLYTEPHEWIGAVHRSAPEFSSTLGLAERLNQPAIAVTRVQTTEQGTTVEAPACSWNFKAIGSRVIYSTFTGHDHGELTDAALDEMERLLAASPGKANWFLDLRGAHNVAAEASRTWTEWLGARQNCFAKVNALATSPLFPLVLTVAKYRTNTEHLVQIHRDLEPFRRELIGVTSEKMAASVGM